MSSNNYVTPYYFTQPPPNYNLENAWNYNWQHQQAQNRIIQDSRVSIAPPLPPGPPPPPPPPSTSRTTPTLATGSTTPRTPSSHSTVQNTTNVEQRSQSYYNNSLQLAAYRNRRYNTSASGQYNSTTGQYVAAAQYPPTVAQYSSSTGQYSTTQVQYNSTTGQYNSTGTPGTYNANSASNYGRNFYNKRKADAESENLKKSNKKKKKPLSQNIPQRKDWSVLDAKRALMVEKEFNKRHKSQSLIIKFPDLELNREIVSKFNSGIESVHFQQPSTPRFCFVTLKESADPEVIIKELNKIPFGQGYLTAEYKKDREDEINIGPEDIDPLTLYVGNLAQEVTKEDMVNTYPKHKRVDIGYAKKMKYTRYAFVSFKNVNDSIEAFRKTHSTQMYSKSLIVRFRRLNGTVGMPGEPKPQLPQKNDGGETLNGSTLNSSGEHSNTDHNEVDSNANSSAVETESCNNSLPSPWEMVDVSQWETDTDKSIDLTSLKQEPLDDSDSEEEVRKPQKSKRAYTSEDFDLAFAMHRPKPIVEIKDEKDCKENLSHSSAKKENGDTIIDVKSSEMVTEKDSVSVKESTVRDSDYNSDCSIIPPEKIKKENEIPKTDNTYNALRLFHPKPLSRESIPVQVKREPSPEPEDAYREQSIQTDMLPSVTDRFRRPRPVEKATEEAPVKIKSEPIDREDENDGDRDDSSDESDDFNFDKILSNLEARSKRQKKIRKSMQ